MRSGFGDGPKNSLLSDAPGESAHAGMPIRAAHGALLDGSKASARPRLTAVIGLTQGMLS